MSAYTICLIALLIGGLLPTIVLASRGEPSDRLVGMELASGVIVFVLILFSQVAPGQSYDLILPLVLVPLSFAGTLVFTRLMGRHPEGEE
jgi:multisubunit Na+/H+ antiporter MnhF subunit